MRRDLPSDDIRQGVIALGRDLIERFELSGNLNEYDDGSDDEDDSSAIENATYMKVAPRVGLDPDRLMEDIGTFEVHRSRLPTSLFETIVMDMDGIMETQRGPPLEKWTVRESSKLFSPVFDHLVTLFNSTLRNSPKKVGSHLFKAFGAIALLVIEIKLEVGNDAERLDAIAQVIAECENCDLTNRAQQYSLPLHCVFVHNGSFDFFKFERTPTPSFVRGVFSGDPTHLQHELKLPDFMNAESSLPFILRLRIVCEIIFDMFLSAYISGLTTYYDKCEEKEDIARSLQSAEQALATFREAEAHRVGRKFDLADATVERGLLALQESIEAAPKFYRSPSIMEGWNYTEVRMK